MYYVKNGQVVNLAPISKSSQPKQKMKENFTFGDNKWVNWILWIIIALLVIYAIYLVYTIFFVKEKPLSVIPQRQLPQSTMRNY